MRLYNAYLIALAVVLTASTVLLAAYDVQRLTTYLSVYMLECLAMNLLFGYLHPRAGRILNGISYLLAGCFLIIITMQVIAILRQGGVLRLVEKFLSTR